MLCRLLAHDDGFLTRIEQSDLLEIAENEDALLSLDVYPGSFLVKGTPVGTAWLVSGGRFAKDSADRVVNLAAGCLHMGFERPTTTPPGRRH